MAYCILSSFAAAAVALIASVPILPANANPVNPVAIKEWNVERGGRPRDPFATADAVWFVGQAGDYIGRLDPATGKIETRDLEDGSGPHNLIVGEKGGVWYTGNLKGYIGRYSPTRDDIDRFVMPDDAADDPHTMVFDDDQSHIWFTVQIGNFVGRLDVDSGATELIAVPTANARPYGIKLGPDGTIWVALLGTNKLAQIDRETMEIFERPLPAEGARPRRVEATSDGRVWYSDYARGYLGTYDPIAGTHQEWELPGGADSRPYGTARDSEDRIWVVETGVQPNRLVGFDTRAEKIISITPIPSGAGTVRHMHFRAPDIWFGTDASTIGRARVMAE